MVNPQILIVEDELIIAHDIRRMLNKLGYAVSAITPTGEDALLKIKVKQPDLVLMDIKLKGSMSGIETVEQAHALFDVPVVYMTANADKETMDRAKQTGPYGFISKPIQADMLRDVLGNAFSKLEIEKEHRVRES